jgi:hypothetical protein
MGFQQIRGNDGNCIQEREETGDQKLEVIEEPGVC